MDTMDKYIEHLMEMEFYNLIYKIVRDVEINVNLKESEKSNRVYLDGDLTVHFEKDGKEIGLHKTGYGENTKLEKIKWFMHWIMEESLTDEFNGLANKTDK